MLIYLQIEQKSFVVVGCAWNKNKTNLFMSDRTRIVLIIALVEALFVAGLLALVSSELFSMDPMHMHDLIGLVIAGVLLAAIFSFLLGSWMALRLQRMQQTAATANQRADHYQERAETDPLTGLLNRERLLPELQRMMIEADRTERLLAVIFLDLNHFKRVNDELGHAMGDVVLTAVAHRLQASFRSSDRLFRVGGDEFVLLLGGLDSVAHCEVLLHRALSSLHEPVHCPQCAPLQIEASMGAVFYPLCVSADPEQILEYSDRAMYAAKQATPPYLRIYDTSMRDRRPPVPIDPR